MSAAQMRQLINTVSLEDDFIAFCTGPQVLTEGVLSESALADRIKAVADKLSQRYNGVKYDLLARATNKAMDLFATKNVNPSVQKTLQRIGKVGKFAINNRALVAILIGMVGTLIGLAHSPTAMANAAGKMDQTLSGTLDDIIHKLSTSGIDVGHETGDQGMLSDIINNLPPDTAHNFEKAAKALRAIENYEFRGVNVSSETSLSDMQMDGEVTKSSNTFDEHILLKTLDGKLTLAELTTHMVDGKIETSHTGIGQDLRDILDKLATLPDNEQKELADYISNGNPGNVQFQRPDGFLASLLTPKKAAIGLGIAALLAKKPDGRYLISFGPKGAKVTPKGGAAPTAPQNGAPTGNEDGLRKQVVDLALKAHGGSEKSRAAVAAKVQQIPAAQLQKYITHYQSEISKPGA